MCDVLWGPEKGRCWCPRLASLSPRNRGLRLGMPLWSPAVESGYSLRRRPWALVSSRRLGRAVVPSRRLRLRSRGTSRWWFRLLRFNLSWLLAGALSCLHTSVDPRWCPRRCPCQRWQWRWWSPQERGAPPHSDVPQGQEFPGWTSELWRWQLYTG